MIVHIAKWDEWEQALSAGVYRGDTLDSEGFIHCSRPDQIIRVANQYYFGRKGRVLLVIDPQRVAAEVRHEALEAEEAFPHIYGPLNTDAVVQVLGFEPGPDGRFEFPAGLEA